MATINTNNYYTSYFTTERLTAWIKTGEYENTFGEVKTVITELIVTKEGTKEVVYKYVSYNGFISYYYNKDGFSLSDIIEDLLIYIANNKTVEYYKNRFIESALHNEYKGLSILKRFKKEHENELKEIAIKKEIERLTIIENDLLLQVNEVVKEIENKKEIRFIKPNERNNYNYEFYTKNTYKLFETDSSISENIKCINNMLEFLKRYNDLLLSDFDPIEFLEFDKVA